MHAQTTAADSSSLQGPFGGKTAQSALIDLQPLLIRPTKSLKATASPAEPPILLVNGNGRGIALDSVRWTTEPFTVSEPIPFNADSRTRIMMFAQNLDLLPGEVATSVFADAEDSSFRRYDLTVEYVGDLQLLSGTPQHSIKIVIIRFSNLMFDGMGDVKVRIYYRGLVSNPAPVAIRSVTPTPTPSPTPKPTVTPTPTPTPTPKPTVTPTPTPSPTPKPTATPTPTPSPTPKPTATPTPTPSPTPSPTPKPSPSPTPTPIPTPTPGSLTAVFSTYLGGSGEDTVRDVTNDAAGNIYVTGGTASSNFLTTAGAYDRTQNGSMDVYVAKFSPTGTLLWSTFIGGPNYDRAYAIEIDSSGVYVGGRAGTGFPTTAGAVQRTFGGDNNPNALYGTQDGFITKISLDGTTLLWSTYCGGADRSFFRDIAVDASNSVYGILTDVSAQNPHITASAFQTSLQGGDDAVVVKLSSNASSVAWATYFGGSGYDLGTPSIRVNAAGNVWVSGFTNSSDIPTTSGAYDTSYNGSGDIYVGKLNPSGTALIYGTYFGGSAVEFSETHGLAVDSSGNAYLGATTKSSDLPTTANAFDRTYNGSGGSSTGSNSNYPGDAFVAKISSDGRTLLAATYLGGSVGEGLEGIALDSSGNVYVAGASYSTNFPVTSNAFQKLNSGQADFFAAKLSGDLGQLLFSSLAGGGGSDFGRAVHASSTGDFYVVGMSNSNDFSLLSPAQGLLKGGIDGVVIRFSPN